MHGWTVIWLFSPGSSKWLQSIWGDHQMTVPAWGPLPVGILSHHGVPVWTNWGLSTFYQNQLLGCVCVGWLLRVYWEMTESVRASASGGTDASLVEKVSSPQNRLLGLKFGCLGTPCCFVQPSLLHGLLPPWCFQGTLIKGKQMLLSHSHISQTVSKINLFSVGVLILQLLP